MSEQDDWDDEDRAIARALGADVDAVDEQRVDEYREVLAHLAPEAAPRADLEDDVVAAALARRPAVTTSVDGARRRRANRLRVAVLVAAVVAFALVAGLIVSERDTGTPAPSAHLLTTVQRPDVTALSRAPGTRSGVFRPVLPTRGRVLLGANGKGVVYDLRTDAPVSLGLISSGGSTVIGPTRAVNGSIGFLVDHPERVTAVDLIRSGSTIGRAQLTSS